MTQNFPLISGMVEAQQSGEIPEDLWERVDAELKVNQQHMESWNLTNERRKRGDTKHFFMEKLTDLLDFAEITPTFRKKAIDELEEEFDYGVSPGDELDEYNIRKLLHVTDDTDPEVTVFEIYGAEVIERNAYRLDLGVHFASVKIAEEEQRPLYPHQKEDAKILAQWRQEFIEKFGQEP